MKNVYYAVWGDAINYEIYKNGGKNHWKTFTFAYMSIFMSLNILALLSAFLFLTGYNLGSKLMLPIEKMSLGEPISNLLWTFLVAFIPSTLINYFSIFFGKKYDRILDKYEFKNGKLLLIYFCSTIVAFFGFSLLNKLGNLPELLSIAFS